MLFCPHSLQELYSVAVSLDGLGTDPHEVTVFPLIRHRSVGCVL
jgi:hypothetical protein